VEQAVFRVSSGIQGHAGPPRAELNCPKVGLPTDLRFYGCIRCWQNYVLGLTILVGQTYFSSV